MNDVGIRELKNRLSEYLRKVRAGEVVQVTDRGEVVAELRPPGAAEGPAAQFPGLVEMARGGLVRLGAPSQPGLYPLLPAAVPPGVAARLLEEERGDR